MRRYRRALEVESDIGIERLRAVVDIDDALRDLCGAMLLKEMRGAARGEVGEILVDAADISVARLARKPQLRRRELRGSRLEKRTFEKDGRRSGRNAGILAAHDAGDGVRTLCVADHQHRGVELALHAVERLDRLAVTRVAHDDRAVLERAVVKGVHRLAELEHHIVRDVYGEAERANAAKL